MKSEPITLFFLLVFHHANSQTNANNYTWIKGANVVNQSGFYGAPGNVSNTPGAREGAMTWTLNGKLYLFGGRGKDGAGGSGAMNDLWEYNTNTNGWTFLKGSATANNPGNSGLIGVTSETNLPRSMNGATTWVANGKLYLFGGQSYIAVLLSELWEYNPANNNWTWLKGSPSSFDQEGIYGIKGTENSNNVPGARYWAHSWQYNGNLYLFGGYGIAAVCCPGKLNDLWMFNISTNNWTWIGGDNIINQVGIYGSPGIGSTSFKPGARYSGAETQTNEKFYLFGGDGYGQSGAPGLLNDLWEYNVILGEWKYLKGNQTINHNGVYNTQALFDPTTKPGSRNSSQLLAYNNKLYLFGGSGLDINDASAANLNDLFIYDSSTNNWVWQRGSDNSGGNGSFGTQGVTNSTNRPSARYSHKAWYVNHKLYFFGGYGEASINGNFGYLNDLWTYIPICSGPLDFFSIKNGNWNDPTTWSCGSVPVTTDQINIKGHTININGNFGVQKIIFEGGAITFPMGSTLTYYPLTP